ATATGCRNRRSRCSPGSCAGHRSKPTEANALSLALAARCGARGHLDAEVAGIEAAERDLIALAGGGDRGVFAARRLDQAWALGPRVEAVALGQIEEPRIEIDAGGDAGDALAAEAAVHRADQLEQLLDRGAIGIGEAGGLAVDDRLAVVARAAHAFARRPVLIAEVVEHELPP